MEERTISLSLSSFSVATTMCASRNKLENYTANISAPGYIATGV